MLTVQTKRQQNQVNSVPIHNRHEAHKHRLTSTFRNAGFPLTLTILTNNTYLQYQHLDWIAGFINHQKYLMPSHILQLCYKKVKAVIQKE